MWTLPIDVSGLGNENIFESVKIFSLARITGRKVVSRRVALTSDTLVTQSTEPS